MNKVRRVVTGNNAEGKSCIIADERIEPGLLWRTSEAAPLGRLSKESEAAATVLPSTVARIEPPAGGSAFFYITMPPWETMKSVFEGGGEPGFDREGFHRTQTLDYLFVLNGEIELRLDEGGTLLRAGDVVIQRNTYHTWINHSAQPVHCVASVVKIADAE